MDPGHGMLSWAYSSIRTQIGEAKKGEEGCEPIYEKATKWLEKALGQRKYDLV